jgi:hypothetical protein
MTDEILESFRQNTRNRSLYLPAEGGLDQESFLDLRRMTSVRRSILPDLDVAASMNEEDGSCCENNSSGSLSTRSFPTIGSIGRRTSRMEVDFVTLADNVAVAENKLFIHGGALSQVRVPQLPWPVQVGAAGRLLAEESELGQTSTLSLVVIQPGGDPLFPMQPIPVTLGEQHRISPDVPNLAVLMAIGIGPLALMETGWYEFNFGLNEDPIAYLPLRVSIA